VLRRYLPLLLVPALLLAACTDDEPAAKDDPTTTAAPKADKADVAALEAVEITPGADGAAPTITFDQPLAVTTTVRRVLEEGDGDAVAKGDIAVFDLVLLNGRDGTELSSSYGVEPATIPVDDDLLPGVRIALMGLAAGSQAIVAIAPKDAYAGQGDDEATGIKEDDSLLLYVDLHDVRTPLTRAEGTAVDPVEGLPEVELDGDGQPTITVPEAQAPTELVAQVLVEGEGDEVKAGQTLTVHYTGVLWDGGEQFDSSWDSGSPASFPIGTGAVIPGWDKGLVGQTVGSQVLLVIPPADGYGDSGAPGGSVPGGATLVFVVDILAAG
jgi:peptidylprolyl isomerase